MKRVLLFLALVLAALTAIVTFRTLRFTTPHVDVPPPAAVEPLPGAAERLAAGIRIPTVSHGDSTLRDPAAFAALRDLLTASFPLTHSALKTEVVGQDALLYTWAGGDSSLQPIVLMGHMDVVPVEAGTESAWKHSPFSGAIADGFVWGRGTMDDKSTVFGILEATELLLSSGFRPRRTIHLAFGADEEAGGRRGAAEIARLLGARRVRPLFVLDEGGMVVQGVLPGIEDPVAVVGIAEKGYLTLELTAKGEGGHSSAPPPHTAAGILARAITRLEDNPMPAEIRGASATLFDAIGREMPFGMRMLFANRWLFDPLIEWKMGSIPRSNATIRTTTAVTMLQGSPKDNVLPSRARASVNFRILPGDDIASVTRHAKRVIDDDRIYLRASATAVEPSPVSSITDSAWSLVQRSIRQSYPDAVIAPYLVIGATDSRYFRSLTDNVYRFAALRADTSDVSRAHGTNERVSLAAYVEGIRFLARLMRNAAE